MPPFNTNAERSDWFEEHLHQHETLLRSWLHDRFPTIEDIDDIIQDAYTKVFRAGLQGELRSPKSFLFATARNCAIDVLRRRKIVKFEPLADHERTQYWNDAEGDFTQRMDRKMQMELLRKAEQSLPDRCRMIFRMRKREGKSHAEIAEAMGISVHTVAAQISIGIRKCRQYIVEQSNEGECL
jgi:RNA polymerase sigma factor (sigma-70 family)